MSSDRRVSEALDSLSRRPRKALEAKINEVAGASEKARGEILEAFGAGEITLEIFGALDDVNLNVEDLGTFQTAIKRVFAAGIDSSNREPDAVNAFSDANPNQGILGAVEALFDSSDEHGYLLEKLIKALKAMPEEVRKSVLLQMTTGKKEVDGIEAYVKAATKALPAASTSKGIVLAQLRKLLEA